MAGKYEVWLLRDTGERLDLIEQVVNLSYIRVLNAPGRVSVTVPSSRLNAFLDTPDYTIEIWRSDVAGLSKRIDLTALLRRVTYSTNLDGMTTTTISGASLVDLLNRRIIAYRAEQSQTQKSDFADDMMKAVVRENLGASSGTDYAGSPVTGRDLTSLGFSVQADLGLGPSIDKSFPWRNVLLVLQEIAEGARVAGTPVYFDVVRSSETSFQFQTFVNQMGQDRTSSSTSPVIIGLEYGNLGRPSLMLDWESELTHIYAGGEGDSATNSRLLTDIGDTERKNQSIWNRREGWVDSKQDTTANQLTSTARAALELGRPRKVFDGTILDVASSRYMTHWDLGDKVTVDYLGQRFDALITAVRVEVEESGLESVTGVLRIL